jgi:tetratricopeptide (TPR) repeat protein
MNGFFPVTGCTLVAWGSRALTPLLAPGHFLALLCRPSTRVKCLSMRQFIVSLALCSIVNVLVAQQQGQSDSDSQQTQSSSQSDREKSRPPSSEAGESSSRDTRIDLTPPKDDAKEHPNEPADAGSDVGEMHAWNPYRAVKDDEVGDFYFKQKNYKAALARYQDALDYKQNDAVANFKMAQCYEKLGQPDQAMVHYREYLKILPEGPFSKQAKKALERLNAGEKQTSSKMVPK